MNTEKKVKEYLEKIKREDKKINSFLFVRQEKVLLEEAKKIDERIKSGKAGKLAGKIISIKSNINVLGLPVSCASKVLENYIATYDADVIKKIKEEDGIIIGMTNMDEFACGGSGETSAFGPTHNPKNFDLITGGSSSGSCASVAAGFCDMSLGSDTGGSIRNPASHCGVVGLKPTYGSVSRNGLIDLSMSLDQIGPIANNIEDCKLLLEVVYGKSENDSISEEEEGSKKKNMKDLVVGVLDFEIEDKRIQKLIDKKVEEFVKRNKCKVKKVKIKHIDLAIETYYPLVYVEFFSGTRKFDSRRYGKKIEEFCGPEVLRRILGGSEVTKAEYGGRYYHKALIAKELIRKEFEKAFNDVDCIICPVVPRLAHKIGEKISVDSMYSYDALTIPANLAGICSVSIPVGEIDKCPVGMQIMGNRFEDFFILEIAKGFE
jgi:aspartyl-tRNA(Asn)/glutamyl-tRNA(Gln) amidotransferase subunit A